MMTPLPVDESLPALRATLAAHRAAVLQAPPGAGKTTHVPLALLDEPWLAGRSILMLEPRRLAARAAAARMAHLRGERVGETVGYRIRFDSKVSAKTRIEVLTEGILTRRLQSDQALEGVGLVIFDEFHERHLHADLALALTLDSQRNLREDLKILVMSATLDGAAVSRLLDRAPIVTSEGRSYAVEIRYVPTANDARISEAMSAKISDALAQHEGDVLAFLPGAWEIRRTQELLQRTVDRSVDVLPLYSDLPWELQDKAIQPSVAGRRKIVLATPIAETSLTIDGVRVVVDCGYARAPQFDPGSGLTGLVTQRISRASADQRAGRAGRTAPGVCYRLWGETVQHGLIPQSIPEIRGADLAPLALELASWGARDAATLSWLDPPPAAAFAQARELLQELDALDQDGAITDAGRAMATLPLHPRLAHMLHEARKLDCAALACDTAALLSERDVLTGEARRSCDFGLRLEALRAFRRQGRAGAQAHGADPSGCQRVDQAAAQYRQIIQARAQARIGSPPSPASGRGNEGEGRSVGDDKRRPHPLFPPGRSEIASARSTGERSTGPFPVSDSPPGGRGEVSESLHFETAGVLLAFAYPDRVALARAAGGNRYLLASGRGAQLPEKEMRRPACLVAASMDAGEGEGKIHLAAPVNPEDLRRHLAQHLRRRDIVRWDEAQQAVIARREERFGELLLDSSSLDNPDPEALRAAMLVGIGRMGLECLPWTPVTREWQARVLSLRQWCPDEDWPDVSDAALQTSLEEWLGPYLDGITRRAHLTRLDLLEVLQARLDWKQQQRLEEGAPTHLEVPSGSRIRVTYAPGEPPVLAVKLQEMFGLADTPRVAWGRAPVTLHLLSPAKRPIQVTQDLRGFWERTYTEVKKKLKGRYPKHPWPDDPWNAKATARVKRRS